MLKKKWLLSGGLMAGGLVLLAVAAIQLLPPPPPQSSSVEPLPPALSYGIPPDTSDAIVYDEEYLKDKLYITSERAGYQTGQLLLKIPRLGVNCGLQNGTTEVDMAEGPSLYEYSQLPGDGNRNISVVAHRDIEGAEFYFANKLGKGDLFYLVYNEKIYTYTYEETYVVEADDWGPIYGRDYPCLTLTTCTPIGVSTHRLVVHARLIETLPYVKGYDYKPWADGLEKQYAWERGAVSWDAKPESEASSSTSAESSEASAESSSSSIESSTEASGTEQKEDGTP